MIDYSLLLKVVCSNGKEILMDSKRTNLALIFLIKLTPTGQAKSPKNVDIYSEIENAIMTSTVTSMQSREKKEKGD